MVKLFYLYPFFLALFLGCESKGTDSSESAKKAAESDKKKISSEGDLDGDAEGDLPADEPAQVAGSYLTCEEISHTTAEVDVGCTLQDKSKKTVDLKKNDYDPEIFTAAGVITPINIEHFTGKPKYHWEVTLDTMDLDCKLAVKLIMEARTYFDKIEIKDFEGRTLPCKEREVEFGGD